MARARTRPAFSSAEAHARDWMWRLDHRSGGPLSRLPPRQALRLVYDAILHREPDPAAEERFLPWLRGGATPQGLVEWLLSSAEWRQHVPKTELGPSLHVSRSQFVQGLPPARRILDLGGTAIGADEGAMVLLGYPYRFEELVIVDLPSEDRDALYQEQVAREVVETSSGPVRYRYHSMIDLSDYESESFDLVYSGQSIEHVSVKEAEEVLHEVFRVLRPSGFFALDTPNARVTRLQQDDFIDPDHEHEYTHAELVEVITGAGFEIVDSRGCNYAGECLRRGEFSIVEVATRGGLYAAIEDCYLLAYLCRKPRPR